MLDLCMSPVEGVPKAMLTQPSCSAEVIKIEHPTRGDDTRAWGPPYLPYSADSQKDGPGEAAYFLAVSHTRTKRPRRVLTGDRSIATKSRWASLSSIQKGRRSSTSSSSLAMYSWRTTCLEV